MNRKPDLLLLHGALGSQQQFIPLIDKPQLMGNVLKTQKPNLPAGLTAVGTYFVLSEVESLAEGKVKNERRTRMPFMGASAA